MAHKTYRMRQIELEIDASTLYMWVMRFGFEKRWVKQEQEGTRA